MKTYEELSDVIFRHCFFRIGDREKAKDLMQDTFMKSWQYVSTGTAKVNNLKSFLFCVANNLIIDEYRKKKEFSLDTLMENGFDPGFDDRNKTESAIDARFVLDLVKKLDDKYKDVIMMRYMNDMSPGQISTIIGESENNVSVRIHRGLKQLKAALLNG
jgi:RNA polymerase sigma-70 factor (ECF subfamily)